MSKDVTRITGMQDKEDREEEILEVTMAENFPKLTKIKCQISESQRTPDRINYQKSRHQTIPYKNYRSQRQLDNLKIFKKEKTPPTYIGTRIRI